MCQSLWCEKACSFRPFFRLIGDKDESPVEYVESLDQKVEFDSGRPLTSRRDLIRADFPGCRYPIATPQCFARTARELFIPHSKPLKLCS